MNHVATIGLVLVAVVAIICATILAAGGHDAAAIITLPAVCVAGITGYTVGARKNETPQ